MALRFVAPILICLTAHAVAAKPGAAVLPLQARGVDKEKVEILDSLVVAELDAVGKYQILGANDLNAMLGFERMRDAVGCSDLTCAAEIGGALGVRYLISGTVSLLGDELIVQLTLTDVNAVAVLERGRAVVANLDTNYRRAVELAVADLFDVAPREALPTAEDNNAPGPAFSFHTGEPEYEFQVMVTTADGRQHACAKPVSIAYQCVLRGLSDGDAHLAITSPPLGPFTDTVDVDWEEIASVEVMEMPSAGSVLTWTFGGIGMASGIALTATGGATDHPQMLYGGLITLGVGLGVLVWGFFFDGNVVVDYPGIDFFFSN